VIILDTNVISELMRPEPDHNVLAWSRSHAGRELCTTAITVAEIHYGIERLPATRRKTVLMAAARDVFAAFDWQVLSFDRAAALNYATLVAERDRTGRPINGFDAQIAAICRSRQATLATRNVPDFQSTGVSLLDPWQDLQKPPASERPR